VIVLTLLYLHRTNRLEFLILRNAMFASGAIGLVIFVSYPVAPPRMLPGFVDTVTENSTSYRILQPPNLVNKYAAVPSLHAGWNLLVGVALYRASTHRTFLRMFGIVSATAMALAVVSTANHYILDVVAGYAVALAGLAISLVITVPIARRIPPLTLWRERGVIKDDAVDSNIDQRTDRSAVLSAPGEEGTSP
jgi:membrane-associated phospholipid phosphatase